MIRSRALAGAIALALLLPALAAAQEARRNPFSELFGRAPERLGREFTNLDFRTTTGAQWADTLEKDFSEATDVPDGWSAGADADVTLEHLRDRFTALGHGRIAYQEYRQDHSFGAPSYDAGGQIVAKATARLSFDASGRWLRSPYFHMLNTAPFAFAEVVLPGDPFAAVMIQNDSSEATAGMTADYSKRSSLNFIGTWRETRFADAPQNDFAARGFRGQWKRRMTRDLTVRAGYGREEVRQRRLGDDRFMNELIDVGVDYAKSLSMSRRTALSFTTETSVLRENGGERRYRINGGAELTHGFQRTWRASIGAHRSTEFLPGFAEPVFSDRARASVSGYLMPRLIFYGNVDGGQGQIGFNDPGKFFQYAGDARLTVAATRHIGVFAQYVYYHYQLPPNAEALALPRLSRQTYSIGIQTWVPLVNKEKVIRDPR